jgi:tetratricopeptide (TPR) repeat protein
MRIFLAAAVLCIATSAAAEDTPSAAPAVTVKDVNANAHLSAAVRLYQKLDLDAALAELQLAEDAAKGNDEDTVQVLIYRGLIDSETGKLSAASDQFKRALAIRPWAEVPEGTSPRIAKNFSDARKSLWGMASVKPPQKRAPAAAVAIPAVAPAGNAPAVQPAVAAPAAPADDKK